MSEVKIKINNYEDRCNVIKALAHAGYKVVVHEVKKEIYGSIMYVKFWVEDDE